MVNQKDAVYNAVVSFLAEKGEQVNESEAVFLAKSDKRTVILALATALEAGEIEVSEAKRSKMTEPKHYREYASNILNNWTRKDKRLNGGCQYEPKRPGSRAGAGDDQIRELKKLRKTMTNDEDIALVDDAIATRLAELKAARAKDKITEIDVSVLPDNIKSLVS